METHKSIIAYSDGDQHRVFTLFRGGEAARFKRIGFGAHNWSGSAGSTKLAAPDGRTPALHKPLTWKNNKIFITLKDLEQTVGGQIVYNPNVQSFALRQTIDTKP